MKKGCLRLFSGSLLLFFIFKFFNINKSERFFNFLAQFYFDQEYYLVNYPELKSNNQNFFKHYCSKGWREGKNPNKNFNSKFYENLYLLHENKYNLNPLADYVRSKFSLKQRYINSSQLKFASTLTNPKYYITLTAIFQNEAKFLKEWIEFYKLIGVEHFYLYNHQSTDNYQEILEPYIKEKIVELRQITDKPKNLKGWHKLQTDIYTEIANEIRDIAEWLIVVDSDEFLFSPIQQGLKSILKKYDQYASLSVNWKIFGSSNVNKIPSDKLLIESLLWTNPLSDTHVKTIVKPRYVKSFSNPHFANLEYGYVQVTENFEYFKGAFSPSVSLNILRINHYWSRDLEFFNSKKLSRIHILGNNLTKLERDAKVIKLINQNQLYSTKFDDSILKIANRLKNKMEDEQ